jgi:regulator of replication initiation timing
MRNQHGEIRNHMNTSIEMNFSLRRENKKMRQAAARRKERLATTSGVSTTRAASWNTLGFTAVYALRGRRSRGGETGKQD